MSDLAARLTSELDERLAAADAALAAGYPGSGRAGSRCTRSTCRPTGTTPGWCRRTARRRCGASTSTRPRSPSWSADDDLVARVRAKLAREPVEDLRIDFEDGYVGKSDADEDADVERAARALAESQQAGEAAPFGGIRIKCFEAHLRSRAIRTLTAFVATLPRRGGTLDGWVVTLPKVTSVDQVEAMVHVAETLDLRFEVQVETPQSILGPDGTALVARMVHAGGERLTGLHYGTYDYSAFVGIAAAYQSLEHPVADHAKLVMQAAAAGTGVRLSDGSTNVLPVGDADDGPRGVGEPPPPGPPVPRARLLPGLGPAPGPAADAVRRDLRLLPRGARTARSTGSRPTSATTRATIADEPATARALARYVLRGVDCGAVDEAEVPGARPERRSL